MNTVKVNTHNYWYGYERWCASTPREFHSTLEYDKHCGIRLIEKHSSKPLEYYHFELLDHKRWLISKLKYVY